MPHSVFGWSYPPGCSGPPEEGRDPSPLSEAVFKLLEDAGMPQEKIDEITDKIDAWEDEVIRQQDKENDWPEPPAEVDDPTKLVPPPDDQEPRGDPCRDY